MSAQGDIDYVNRTDSSDLAYINSAGVRSPSFFNLCLLPSLLIIALQNAIIKMDNVTDVLYPNKRRSVRIESTNLVSLASL